MTAITEDKQLPPALAYTFMTPAVPNSRRHIALYIFALLLAAFVTFVMGDVMVWLGIALAIYPIGQLLSLKKWKGPCPSCQKVQTGLKENAGPFKCKSCGHRLEVYGTKLADHDTGATPAATTASIAPGPVPMTSALPPTSGRKKSKGGSIFILVCILFGLFWYIGNETTSNSVSSVGPVAVEADAKLKVLSWRCTKEYGFIYVQGEVQNISGGKLDNVEAVGAFRTASGELVKSESALVEYTPLMAGQKSPFKAGGTDNPAIKSCDVSFKHLLGGEIPYISEPQQKSQK